MKEYKAGIYLRLSKEDTNQNNSIDSQREITRKYADKNGYVIVKEYVDNGWSGMLDKRPALDNMIFDILHNKINMVIVKDVSRLTRDKNKTGFYTEIFFPDNDIRFISVTEFIDSGKRYEIDDSIMIRGIVNQSYVADISRKIKAVKTNMKKEGKYVEHCVPYGYKKDEKDKYKVVIDENVAKYVKQIFDMYLKGYSQSQIANTLTNMNVDTAKKYKGYKVEFNRWRADSISRILKDPFYTGKMIINKAYTDYKKKKTIKTPKEKWIFKENTHEALVSQEDFDKVQEMLEKKFTKPKRKYEYLLKDLVFCGNCKARMQYKSKKRTKNHNKKIINPKEYWYFKCRMVYRYPDICNLGTNITEKALNEIVLNEVKKRLKKIKIDPNTKKIIDTCKTKNSVYKELQSSLNIKKRLENDIKLLYDNKVQGTVTIEKFKKEYPILKQKEKEIDKKIIELNDKNILSEENLKNIILDFKSGKDLNNDILKQIIEKIEVYQDRTVKLFFKI